MKRIIAITLGIGMTVALAALSGCSRDDAQRGADAVSEAASEAADVASDAADAAGDAASDAMNAATDAASNAAEAVEQKAEEGAEGAKGMLGAAASALGADSPADVCRKLAGEGAWEKALEVCRKAHELFPDDMAIEHALQQAEAAAAE